MIEALEASGELQPSSMLIEPTPGNPGVASTMDRTLIDEGLTIANESASKAAWKPPQLEGLSVGGLSGAAFLAGLDVGAHGDRSATTVRTKKITIQRRHDGGISHKSALRG